MARNESLIKKELYRNNTFNFQLDESTQIDLIKIRTRDFTNCLTPRHIQQNIRVPINGTTTFQQKRMCGKNVSPPSKRYVKSLSSKNFNLNLCNELLLQKESFFVMVYSQTMTVYTVAKGTPSIIFLAIVFL